MKKLRNQNNAPLSALIQLSFFDIGDDWICPMCCHYLAKAAGGGSAKKPSKCPECGQLVTYNDKEVQP